MSYARKDMLVYKSFVVIAVLGKMAEADAIMQQPPLRRSVIRVAEALQKSIATPLNLLYRGLLLPPSITGPPISTNYLTFTYVSFSEDKDVGCWFARPDAYISGPHMQNAPGDSGWVATYTAKLSEILFHWSWQDSLNQSSPNLYEVIQSIAAQNNEDPADWVRQLYFNLKHQQEVMLRPGADVTITPVDQANCPPAHVLDKKLRPRPDFILAPAGLEPRGIAPGTRLYLRDADFPQPLARCPVCGQRGVEIIYRLAQGLSVYPCTICGQSSFVT